MSDLPTVRNPNIIPHKPRQWPVISALGTVMIFTWGSSYYLLAVLARPIADDTGWPLPALMAAFSAGLLLAGLVSPLIGRAIAEFGGRPVLAGGAATLALGLAILGLAPALWVFWLGWLIIGLGMACTLYDPAFATLGRLYGASARGPITVLTLWGGFASTVCWPLSALMLEHWGWRAVAGAYGALHLCLTLPLILAFIPRSPRAAPRPPGEIRKPFALQGREALCFALFAALLIVNGLIVVNISVYLFAFLQAQGTSLAAAVALGAIIGPAQVGARLIEMAGRGRYHPIWTLGGSVISVALGLALLALDMGLPALALILYGGGNGLFSIARGALPLAVFGPDRYPVLMGRLARPALIAQATAPMLGAGLVTWVGSAAALAAIAALGLVTLGLMVALWRVVRAGVSPGP